MVKLFSASLGGDRWLTLLRLRGIHSRPQQPGKDLVAY